eukprot:CCRYP_001174-RA/>CCRYP_001174-RA protein AED:0.27 eAED:0.27 QI:42/1/0.5/1/0/0/2/0/67
MSSLHPAESLQRLSSTETQLLQTQLSSPHRVCLSSPWLFLIFYGGSEHNIDRCVRRRCVEEIVPLPA